MTHLATSRDDKYLQLSGRVFMSSNQALVRLPLDQARRDHALGLRTARVPRLLQAFESLVVRS